MREGCISNLYRPVCSPQPRADRLSKLQFAVAGVYFGVNLSGELERSRPNPRESV